MSLSDWANWAQVTGLSLVGMGGILLFLIKKMRHVPSQGSTRHPERPAEVRVSLSHNVVPAAAAGLVAGALIGRGGAPVDWTKVDVSSAVDITARSGSVLADHAVLAISGPNDPSDIIDHLDSVFQIVSSISDATGGTAG